MPVDFLTADQQRSYGRYAGEPSRARVRQYFPLDDRDRGVIDQLREDHTRLGFAVQLATVRFLGTFLVNPRDVPTPAVAYLAEQLRIADPTCLERYLDRPATHREHTADIRRQYGYRDFSEQPEHFRLVRWLHTRAWLSSERPSILFDLATARLVERKVLLPGVTTLERLVASVRDRAIERLWQRLAAAPDGDQRTRLDQLLVVPAGERVSPLERMIGVFEEQLLPEAACWLPIYPDPHQPGAQQVSGVLELSHEAEADNRVTVLAGEQVAERHRPAPSELA